MKVEYKHYVYLNNKRISKANILWDGKWPMRAGKFPKEHPCNETEQAFICKNPVSDDSPLGKFRARGYWASCFPEGDGISLDAPENKSIEEIKNDIRDCFGWEIKD